MIILTSECMRQFLHSAETMSHEETGGPAGTHNVSGVDAEAAE